MTLTQQSPRLPRGKFKPRQTKVNLKFPLKEQKLQGAKREEIKRFKHDHQRNRKGKVNFKFHLKQQKLHRTMREEVERFKHNHPSNLQPVSVINSALPVERSLEEDDAGSGCSTGHQQALECNLDMEERGKQIPLFLGLSCSDSSLTFYIKTMNSCTTAMGPIPVATRQIENLVCQSSHRNELFLNQWLAVPKAIGLHNQVFNANDRGLGLPPGIADGSDGELDQPDRSGTSEFFRKNVLFLTQWLAVPNNIGLQNHDIDGNDTGLGVPPSMRLFIIILKLNLITHSPRATILQNHEQR